MEEAEASPPSCPPPDDDGPTIDWDEAFQAYLNVLSNGTDAAKSRATLLLARRAHLAPPHLLSSTVPLLSDLILSPFPALRHAASLALLRITSLSATLPSSIPALLSLLASPPPSSAAPRRHLLELLSSLSSLRDARRAIASSPAALRALVDAVSLCRMPYRSRAAHSLGFLASSRRAKRLLVDSGALDALVRLMREGDPHARLAAGNSLGILSAHLDYLRLAARAGAIPLYAELLEGRDPALRQFSPLGREIAEDALCVLAVDADNMAEICRHLARILRDAGDDAKAAAADVFWDLSSYAVGTGAIRDCGAIPLLVGSLREGVSVELREKASGAVAQMSYEEDARAVLAESGAVPTLISMLDCDEDELKENATEALANFAADPLFHESVSAVLDSPTFRSIRDRLVRSNEYMARSLGQVSLDRFTLDLDLS